LKQLVNRIVECVTKEYIEELDNPYTIYTTQTPKTILAFFSKEYCTATIKDKLAAEADFEKSWDQVTSMSTWITSLELLCEKCNDAEIVIDDQWMVLKISTNAMKCPLFKKDNHNKYEELTNYDLATVKQF
jgi:hypothetical protein